MNKSKTSSKADQTAQKGRGLLIVISAPSGCGKTTIVERLLKHNPEWVRSVSATTRQPRSGEKDGVDYFFVTPQKFKDMDARGEFLESANVYEFCYGTPKQFVQDQLAKGRKVILAIDVQGARKIKKVFASSGQLLTVFILPPSVKVLRERLEGRKTESPEAIQRRIEVAQDEIKEAGAYDLAYVNQHLEQTILEIEEGISEFEKTKGE